MRWRWKCEREDTEFNLDLMSFLKYHRASSCREEEYAGRNLYPAL